MRALSVVVITNGFIAFDEMVHLSALLMVVMLHVCRQAVFCSPAYLLRRQQRFDLLPLNRTSYFSKKSIMMENDGHGNQANTAKSRSLDF